MKSALIIPFAAIVGSAAAVGQGITITAVAQTDLVVMANNATGAPASSRSERRHGCVERLAADRATNGRLLDHRRHAWPAGWAVQELWLVDGCRHYGRHAGCQCWQWPGR